ncbi:FecR family protein [Pedobacter endophyticus]|uniref:FecR family protein n=1 Tax=Pedobacter endophyticus TaxID=2789740 RepID=A0A7S9Q017_9SPHI|nr:FecR family protein [Pedobacter endophyticus]QPH40928.1 FecR family protein [Pedobacter endophyticus]
MNKEIRHIFQRYIDGEASQREIDQVLKTLEDGRYQDEWDSLLTKDLDEVIDAEIEIESISTSNASALHNRILKSIEHQPQAVSLPKINRIKSWPGIAVAASILAILSIGTYYFISQNTLKKQTITYQNDVAPGKPGATLTLADGRKILIKEAMTGNIAAESGVKIYKNKSGQIVYEIVDRDLAATGSNMLSTMRGEQMQVILPDGTLVFLNAESSLKYPTSFVKQDEREVSLTGEGYFEVAKDKAHPFIVKTGQQEVEVLGTHFNINSYTNEPGVKTTLLEGSVKISANQKTKILTPGNQAVNINGDINISKVDTELAVAWKNNNFVFDVLSIKEIMRMLERWYNVDVIYTDHIPEGTFWGSVSRFDNISQVLISLEATGNVHFEIKGRKIYVSR